MARILYADAAIIPDMTAMKSAELSFSGTPLCVCGETKTGVSVRGGMETLKRWISSASFSVIVLSGFSEVSSDVKESTAFWVSDHLSEPGSPLLIAVSSGPWKEGVECFSKDDIENYLKNIK